MSESTKEIQEVKEVQNDQENQETNKVTKTKSKKNGIVISFVLVSIILLVYLGFALFFNTHFFPNSTISNWDCSLKKVDQVINELETSIYDDYVLDIIDREGNVVLSLSSTDVDLEVSLEEIVLTSKISQKPLLWISSFWSGMTNSIDAMQVKNYSRQKLEDKLKAAEFLSDAKMKNPENAYIGGYDSQTSEYAIASEKEGTLLDKAITLERVCEAIESMKTVLNLEEQGCYIEPEINSQNEVLVKTLVQLNTLVSTKITYDWNGNTEILDGSIINEWVTFEENKVILDEDKVGEYIIEKAKAYDTYGKNRKFTTTLGEELSLKSGAYGWQTNRKAEKEALIELINQGAVTEREPEYSHTAYVKGMSDIGSSYVEIDLTNQHLYLYIKGKIVLESDFVSGNVSDGNTTPGGVFGLTYKTRNAVLRGADYETPVNFWMPFNGNIGMHDATWRRSFGGEIYLTNGSHGCVNLPLSKAEEIYSYIEEKFPVVCYYY